MRPVLQSGQVVFDRFRLDAAKGEELWHAEDLQTGAAILLAFFSNDDSDADHARILKLRDVQHPGLVGIQEIYQNESQAAVALAYVEGQTLHAHLERNGPMPYRVLLDGLSPILKGVQAIHQAGLVHGDIRPERIWIDGDQNALLLPPTEPVGAHSDVYQFGGLLRAALSGNRLLTRDRELNDVPDLLWEGRTLPALINQLVADMCSPQASQRPAGPGDVLSRLQQIEKVIADPPPVIPVIADPNPTPLTAAAPESKAWIVWVLAIVGLLGLAGVIGLIGFGIQTYHKMMDKEIQAIEKEQARSEEALAEAEDITAEAEPRIDLVTLALEKAEAEEALGKYLIAKKDAESVGAHRWAKEKFAKQMVGAAIADQAFLSKTYRKAADQYVEVALGLDRLKAGKQDALIELLTQGVQELKTGTSASALQVFETALLIDSGNLEAQRGLTRSQTLDELMVLMSKGKANEEQGRVDFAHTDYAEAVTLDPLSEEARSSLERMKAAISEAKFQGMMSSGLQAFEQGAYDEAHLHLREAKAFQPHRKEADDALAMVAEGIRLRRIKSLQELAGRDEAAEEWPGARKAYLQVLEIDENLAFAQDGKQRVEQRITLMTQLEYYLARTQLLTTPEGRKAVNLVISDAEAIQDPGPKLKQAYETLNTLVTQANTKVEVTIVSDGSTEVTVYKVGKLGPLTQQELQILPGTYTVLGQRDGFKDVRHTLKLTPGMTEARLAVICTERF
ncbi:MAG: tetratricopeptide (TPR) repeat protein [Kiritimatiellia bacterium]|jgi:tetratricopeptide (TPR) repeat protein